MRILYKKDSKCKIRVIKFWCENDFFYTESGMLDGKLIQNVTKCTPKNVGKSNETTSEEQAILEMSSKIREKLQEDYFESLEEAKDTQVILPMLAKSYADEKHKIDWSNCYIQPKLDGMRCLAIIKANESVKLISRDGVDIQLQHNSMQHIINDLQTIKEDVILDGELYAHGLSFQDNMKLIKKLRPETSILIKFHVYDLINNEPFWNRKIRCYVKGLFSCAEVSTYQIKNEQELLKYHIANIYDGYEGSIIRWGVKGYKINSRSSNLLKYKDFKDLDAKIVDIIPTENRPEWGIVLCEYNGKQFKATPKMSQEDKIHLLKNKSDYIGKTCIITYFEFTDDNIPRFPIYKGVRLDLQK